MNKLRVAVLTENYAFGKALARGLMGEGSGLEVICYSSEDDFCRESRERKGEDPHKEIANNHRILVTDMAWAFQWLPASNILFLKGLETAYEAIYQLDKLSPVRAIYSLLTDIYIDNTGKEFTPLAFKDVSVVGILSPFGGSGATVVSITLARALAYKRETGVLYMNLGERDDYFFYVRGDESDIKGKKELLFSIEEGRKEGLRKFLISDEHNVQYFLPGEGRNCFDRRTYIEKVLRLVGESGLFSYVIVDLGRKEEYVDLCHLVCRVYDQRDMRSRLISDEAKEKSIEGGMKKFDQEYLQYPCSGICEKSEEVTIYNFVGKEFDNMNFGNADFGNEEFAAKKFSEISYSGSTDNSQVESFQIREDVDSFVEQDGFIQISMEGTFAEDVEAIAEKM